MERLLPFVTAALYMRYECTYASNLDHCRAILANGRPWISLDVCFNRYESGLYKSVITSCTNNGSAISVTVYNDTDCSGTIMNETIQIYDPAQLQCEGTICSHAVIRNYDATNCDRSGDFTEFPFPVRQCFILSQMSKYFGSVRFECNDTGVYTQIYPTNVYDCDSSLLAHEYVAWDEYGECNDDYQWSEFVRCKANRFQIWTTVFLFVHVFVS